MSDLTISESGDYFYIMQGESDADCWPQYKEAANPDEEIIIRLCKKVMEQRKQLEQQAESIEVLVEGLLQAAFHFEDFDHHSKADACRAIANKFKTNKKDK